LYIHDARLGADQSDPPGCLVNETRPRP